VGLVHRERHGYSLLCIKYCVYGPDQPMLADEDRGNACLICKREHGVQKFANLCKFGKEYWWTQDCLNWSDHCSLLFLHESMLQINHWKSTLWLNTCATMWITVNVQNAVNYGWKSCCFFTAKKFFPLCQGKKNLVFY